MAMVVAANDVKDAAAALELQRSTRLLKDATTSAADKELIIETLKNLTPDEAFLAFDDNNDGLITFIEFRSLLPYLAIKISDAKALRYFKMCDTRGIDSIDIDEFKTAIFACDPVSSALAFITLLTLLMLSLFAESHSIVSCHLSHSSCHRDLDTQYFLLQPSTH